HYGRGISDQPEALFTFAQGCFCLFALRHIPDDNGQQLSAIHFRLRNRSLDRELLPACSHTPKRTYPTLPSSAGAGIAQTLNLLAERLLRALRDEAIDGTSDCVLCQGAKYFFSCIIEHNDLQLIINSNDRVHRGLDYALQLVPAFA